MEKSYGLRLSDSAKLWETTYKAEIEVKKRAKPQEYDAPGRARSTKADSFGVGYESG